MEAIKVRFSFRACISVSVINVNPSQRSFMTKVLTTCFSFSGLLVKHPGLGLEAGRPGSLHQRGQVWPPRPVLPCLRLLHHGEQHDDHQPARHHSGDAALEEGLPFNLQQSCPRRNSLPNFCRLLLSGAKDSSCYIHLFRRLLRSAT